MRTPQETSTYIEADIEADKGHILATFATWQPTTCQMS